MMSMICSIWDDFSNWVSLGWSQTTFIIIVSVLGLCGLMGVLSFFKKSVNKDKRPKWGTLIVSIIMFGLLVLFVSVRFT